MYASTLVLHGIDYNRERCFFTQATGILPDKRNSYVFLKQNTEMGTRVHGYAMMKTRPYTVTPSDTNGQTPGIEFGAF